MNQPKIRAYSVNGQTHFEWDKDDPELIAAGINDMSLDEWGALAAYVEAQAASQPVVEIRDGVSYWIEPGKEPVVMTEDKISELGINGM